MSLHKTCLVKGVAAKLSPHPTVWPQRCSAACALEMKTRSLGVQALRFYRACFTFPGAFMHIYTYTIYIYIYVHIFLSVDLSIDLSISIYIYLSIYLSICLSIYPSTHPSIYLSIYLSSIYIYILFLIVWQLKRLHFSFSLPRNAKKYEKKDAGGVKPGPSNPRKRPKAEESKLVPSLRPENLKSQRRRPSNFLGIALFCRVGNLIFVQARACAGRAYGNVAIESKDSKNKFGSLTLDGPNVLE